MRVGGGEDDDDDYVEVGKKSNVIWLQNEAGDRVCARARVRPGDVGKRQLARTRSHVFGWFVVSDGTSSSSAGERALAREGWV